ncbi:hypothetical protein ACH4VR_29290 [Streptomyces sp. NPDC020883]|uniref:hypothetical protein n=1 Tax=Streptomyces sp. NPDC020883 TaxID=3365099 RepID=UPI0037B054C2
MTNPDPVVPVLITNDTTAVIHGEPVSVPPGVTVDQAVMSYLQLEAAGVGATITVHIDDRRHAVNASLLVNPDGTTGPQEPAPDSRTPKPTRELSPLASVRALAVAGDLNAAITRADTLLRKWSADPSLGPQHPTTLEMAQARAELASITQDYPYAYAAWSWLAATWHEKTGRCPRTHPHDHEHCRHIAMTTSKAATAWMQLPTQVAMQRSHEILELIENLAGSDKTPAGKAVRDRIAKWKTLQGEHQ